MNKVTRYKLALEEIISMNERYYGDDGMPTDMRDVAQEALRDEPQRIQLSALTEEQQERVRKLVELAGNLCVTIGVDDNGDFAMGAVQIWGVIE